MTETSPGWYPDPLNPIESLRWWDGAGWTEEICERPIEPPLVEEEPESETETELDIPFEEEDETKENTLMQEEALELDESVNVDEVEMLEEEEPLSSLASQEEVLQDYLEESEDTTVVEETSQFEKVENQTREDEQDIEPVKNNVVVVEEIVDKVASIGENPKAHVRCVLIGKYEGFDESVNSCLLRRSLTETETYPPAFRNIFEMLLTAPTLEEVEDHFKEHSSSLLESLLALKLMVRLPDSTLDAKDFEEDITVLLSSHLYRNHELPSTGEMIPLGNSNADSSPETKSLVMLGVLISGGVECIATSLLRTAKNLQIEPENAYEQFSAELPSLIGGNTVWICPPVES